MWNVKTKVIPVIAGATGTVSETLKNVWTSYPDSTVSRYCGKQPCKALCTYWEQHCCTNTECLWQEITWRVLCAVTTEQLQYFIS
jgi:hypothetical protein